MGDRLPSTASREKTFAAYDGQEASGPLSRLYLDLMDEQKRTWPALRRAYASLHTTMDREIRCTGFLVRVQHNPGRIASTIAPVKGGATDGRPCFLCQRNLPPQQKGILYCGSWVILPNPMPVFPFHSTVAHVRHQHQGISGNMEAFLGLIGDLGDEWTILYNGPKCGASAPDHLHFQVVPSGLLPVETEIWPPGRLAPLRLKEGAGLYRAIGLGRQAIVLVGHDPRAVAETFQDFLEALREALSLPEEPMINIVGYRKEGRTVLVVFPRRKHRPDAFFRTGDDRILLSPAVVEMAGVLVAPAEADFRRLDAHAVEALFDEVSLEAELLDTALQAIS
jgi:hypothetical protein